MTARIVSIANMKGGVGKTTIAVALAHLFSQTAFAGCEKVLLIDLDAQANASFWLCGDEKLAELIQSGKTVDAFLEDRVIFNQPRTLNEFAHTPPRSAGGTKASLSLIPCSPELRMIERQLVYFLSAKSRDLREVERAVGDVLRAELESLKSQYDLIIFDTAPGISAVTEAALHGSDVVVVPTVPDFISNLGLEAFCRSVWWQDPAASDVRLTPWVVANMVRDTSHHRATLGEMRAEAASEDGGFRMFRSEIPSLMSIEEACGRLRERGPGADALFSEEATLPFRNFATEVFELAHAGP